MCSRSRANPHVARAPIARRARAAFAVGLMALGGVGGIACANRAEPPASAPRGATILPDVRTAPGRPPVVLVSRQGDPVSAVAVAVTTEGIGLGDDGPEMDSALSGFVETRLRAKAIDVAVTPTWGGLRASALAGSEAEATRIAVAIRDAFQAPATDAELASANRKLVALAQMPLQDRARRRWARCVGEPQGFEERKGRAEIDLATLERWRASSLGLGRVAIAVTGPASIGEAVARSVLRGPSWSTGASIAPRPEATELVTEVFELRGDGSSSPFVVHMTLDVGTSNAAVTTAEALGDPSGPLSARLSNLELPFRLREITGAAHARGGCVGVILEAVPGSTAAGTPSSDIVPRIADAVALVHVEAGVHLSGVGTARDGRNLPLPSGDAREAAERASWWALADLGAPSPSSGGSVALGVPVSGGARDAPPAPSREALATAIGRARSAWDKPVLEARSRVESGQGEAWILLASTCGTEGETDADAGLTALFTTAAAETTTVSADVHVEPWIVADGTGVLVHGPMHSGETPVAHARRLADIAARIFAAEPITAAALGRARADLLRHDARRHGTTLSVLAQALSPQHSSSVAPFGTSETLARFSDASAVLRAQALRGGPLRVAVLANANAAQADAAVRAADRWVARRTGEPRACPATTSASPPRPGTYAISQRPGSVPEAYLAFPLPAGDDAARGAAFVVASALDGDGALLDKALTGKAVLARQASATVLGWPRAPALVVRIVAPQTSLDDAVMQARALVDRIHKAGLSGADYDLATAKRARTALTTSLDPRARVVATWRGEPIDAASRQSPSAADVRTFAQKYLSEDAMVVVAARPPRPPPVTP